MLNLSIWPIDWTRSGASTPAQSGPARNDSEEEFCIPQNSSITGDQLSDCLVSNPGHSVRGFYCPSPSGMMITVVGKGYGDPSSNS